MGLVIVSSSVFSYPYSLSRLSLRKSPPISTRFHHRRWLKSPCCRLNGFATTCFITNGEVEVNQFATESELSKDLLSVPSGCSTIPIVHLDSEILKTEHLKLLNEDSYIDNLLTPLPILSKEEQDALAAIPSGCSTSPIVHLDSDLQSEPLKLLNEDNYIDNLLTTLPVLSEEEQDALAAIPAHPAGLYALYATSLAGNLVEQLWNFAWPAAVALLHPSLLPVAVVGCFTKLAIFVGGPLIGNLMDTYPRALAYNSLCLVQTAAQLISVAMVIHALNTISPASSVLLQPWFVVLVLAGAIERLTGLATGVALERDWVVLLAGRNRPIALARANAMLSRIDLLCEIAGASLFGILLSKYDPVTCLTLAAGLMIYTMPVLVLLVWLTNKLSSGVLERPKFSHTCDQTYRFPLQDGGNLVERSFNAIKNGWLEYKQQPVLPASLAYVFLCFNVVLAPGSLMTSFLIQRGLNPSIIGGFSGLCAFMGLAATFISAALVKRFGILKAGAAGLIFQASLLTIAVAVYWSGSLSQQTPLLFFLCLIVLSRLGHMSYDVVGQQILQTGIPTTKANLIGTTEVSMASLAEFVMLGVAIVANDASHFGLLAMLSVSSVVGAAWMFCRWLGNPTDEHRQLFSFDPHF